jgi:NAD(P)-dependent dehydrogenase (short-subunit alcohol dehydrogenase family)
LIDDGAIKMLGKTCLITGATNGIGRVTAVELARMGAELFLLYRNQARADETLADIRHRTGNENVHLIRADLESQQQIRAAAAGFLATGKPLHVLINNAGLGNTKRLMTDDGIEMVFAVNHLAYFLLTMLLLDRIKESAPARIVNVASEAHRFGTINFDDLGGEQRFRTFGAYSQSKLANILFSYELSRRLRGTGVTVNCLHPAGIASGLWTNNGPLAQAIMKAGRFFLKTPEQGAKTTIYLASSHEVEGVTGKYYSNSREKTSSRESYDLNIARKLWDVSTQMTGIDPEALVASQRGAPLVSDAQRKGTAGN